MERQWEYYVVWLIDDIYICVYLFEWRINEKEECILLYNVINTIIIYNACVHIYVHTIYLHTHTSPPYEIGPKLNVRSVKLQNSKFWKKMRKRSRSQQHRREASSSKKTQKIRKVRECVSLSLYPSFSRFMRREYRVESRWTDRAQIVYVDLQ